MLRRDPTASLPPAATSGKKKTERHLLVATTELYTHYLFGCSKDHDYSLQGNAKTIEGRQHPDCGAEFRYLNDQVTAFLAAGLPLDTKKVDTTPTPGCSRSIRRWWTAIGSLTSPGPADRLLITADGESNGSRLWL